MWVRYKGSLYNLENCHKVFLYGSQVFFNFPRETMVESFPTEGEAQKAFDKIENGLCRKENFCYLD